MAERMRRTQIYLEPDLSAALDRLARKDRTTRAALIRQAARRLVDEQDGHAEEDPIWSIVGIGESRPGAPTDVSERHDQYLVELLLKEMREFRKRRS